MLAGQNCDISSYLLMLELMPRENQPLIVEALKSGIVLFQIQHVLRVGIKRRRIHFSNVPSKKQNIPSISRATERILTKTIKA